MVRTWKKSERRRQTDIQKKNDTSAGSQLLKGGQSPGNQSTLPGFYWKKKKRKPRGVALER